MNKKATKIEAETTAEEQQKKDTEKEHFNRLLDIVEQKKEERKYRPGKAIAAIFTCVLASLLCATCSLGSFKLILILQLTCQLYNTGFP